MRPVLHYRGCGLEFGLLEGVIFNLFEEDGIDSQCVSV